MLVAFQVNQNNGFIPPTGGPQPTRFAPPVQQQPTSPTDGFVPTQHQQVQQPPPQPQVHQLNNGLQIQAFGNGQQQTGLYATLPGGPGGLLGAPIMISLSTLPAENTLGASFQQAQAYEMGADGKAVRDENNQPKTLPTSVMADGRVYVQTNKDNPNAPLVMLDPDGSFGLATPAQPKVQGDSQFNLGYTREQAEFVKPDGSRGFRVKEDVGAFQQGEAGGGLGSMLTGGMLQSNAGARPVTYTEVQQTQKGLESRDLHFSQQPGAPWPGFSQGNKWISLSALNGPDSRERSVVQQGPGLKLEGGWTGKRMLSLLSGKSGLGTNSWTYGKQEPIYFVPLSTQQNMAPQGAPPPLVNTPPVFDNSPPPLPNGF